MTSFRAKADRLIEGVLSEGAENLFGRISILNAADLRIGGAEIVIAGPTTVRSPMPR